MQSLTQSMPREKQLRHYTLSTPWREKEELCMDLKVKLDKKEINQ